MRPAHGDGPSVAFVGRREELARCVPPGAAVLEHRGGPTAGLRHALGALDPDVVVALGPEALGAGAFDGLRATTLGVLTSTAVPADADQFDRLAATPGARPAAAPWRTLPLPVADAFFSPVAPVARPPRLLFLGPSSPARERWLIDVKHHFDLLHVAGGLQPDGLARVLARTDVGVATDDACPVALHLAAGHLVLAAPLARAHGLEPDIDHLEVSTPRGLLEAAVSLRAYPGAFDAVRRRGRLRAEPLRASRVWPRLLGDLRADVAAFGTARRGRAALVAR